VHASIQGKEGQDMALSELALRERQELASLDEQATKEAGKIKEVIEQLTAIVKSIKPFIDRDRR